MAQIQAEMAKQNEQRKFRNGLKVKYLKTKSKYSQFAGTIVSTDAYDSVGQSGFYRVRVDGVKSKAGSQVYILAREWELEEYDGILQDFLDHEDSIDFAL